jgi:arsenate reductase
LGGDQVYVASAGLEASFVDPLTVQVMQEVGIDISQQRSKPLSEFQPADFDAVISLCGCGVNLPPEWLTRDYFADWQLGPVQLGAW